MTRQKLSIGTRGKFLNLPIINKIFSDKSRLWLVFLIFLPLILFTINNPNNDYGLVSEIVRAWVEKRVALYTASSVYFNYTPWLLFFYIPFAFIPQPFGQLIFNIISLSLVIWSTWYLSKPISWKALAVAMTTIYMVMLVFQVQMDAFVLASLTLGWIGVKKENPFLIGLALVGMTTKYTNVIIPICLLLFAIRKWSIKRILLITILPAVIILSSFFLVGWDWPIRYIRLLKETLTYFHQYEVNTVFSTTNYPISYRLIHPPLGDVIIISFAIISLYLLFRLSRIKVDNNVINLGIALNLVISPYFTFHHLIYLAPLQAQLLNKNKVWGAILYGAALIDLLFLWFGIGLIIYPVVALLILIIINISNMRRNSGNFSVQVINQTE
jgi:hypothetical protein